ncbi:MAG: DUF5011 domain-containing protein [Clostridium sp.]|nr:DUF5011 domain-containing protein [Clostridium sp.]MCM1444351.1 DUF5011 domain-containing protein [Candidatus Amulumruptor caecigallinarius]
MKKGLNILLAISILILQFVPITTVDIVNGKTDETKRNENSYWSEDNMPIFYGATKITLEIGSVSEFNFNDTRFRIFAKDFEDGDLTTKITHTGSVDVNKVGTYNITYRVTDSHNNTSVLNVPVIVKDHDIKDGNPSSTSNDGNSNDTNKEEKEQEKIESISENEIQVQSTEISELSDDLKQEIKDNEEDISKIEGTDEIDSKQVDETVKELSSESESKQNIDNESTTEEKDTYKINVERTLYTIPSVWNMDMVGTNRNNYGDRQILGIYMPANTTIKARILSATNNITVSFLANDSAVESSMTLKTNGEWVELKNIKNDTSYDSVPLFTSSVMKKGENIHKVFKVELEYDSSVKELNYYHQNDNEIEFRNKWNNEKNTYGIIENEVLNVVVPYKDINKLTNYYSKGFTSLDQFLEYWQKVVDRMDEIMGLDLNPVNLTDQNVRTKYLVKANIHGVGAAYYSGNHVGIHNSSVASFFEMNWGGLHEFAHGYQGSFGKGQMSLGEVSNNIIGHYIQVDKSIYFHSGDWLGSLPIIEENKNKERFDGKTFQETQLSTRLYALINLFDSLEGADTYTKMFKWYRSAINEGKSMTNQDAYVLSIADIYGVNIIPYMEDWRLVISDSVKNEIYDKNYPMLSIVKDTVSSDNLNKIMSGENLNRKYSLVTNDILSKYNINGSLKINVEIDNIDYIKGNIIRVNSEDKTIKTIKIDDKVIDGNTIKIADLPVGTYYIQMPIVNGYSQGYLYTQIKESEDSVYTYKYEKQENQIFEYVNINIKGYTYDTKGFILSFSDNYKKVLLSPGQAGMSGSEYVRIYDDKNNLLFEDAVSKNANGKYFNFDKGNQTLDIKPGYVIEINYPNKYASKVQFISSLTGKNLSGYSMTNQTTRYIIMENGIRKEETSESEANDIAYSNIKPILVNIIETYMKKATEDRLSNKWVDFMEKQYVLNAYNNLKDEDKTSYIGFINSIKSGGAPNIQVVGKLEYEIGENIDLYSLIKATDNEDGEILINKESTTIETSLNTKKAGSYNVIYKVLDSNGNISTCVLKIVIKGIEEEKKEQVEITKNDETLIPSKPSVVKDNISKVDKENTSNSTKLDNNEKVEEDKINNETNNEQEDKIDNEINNEQEDKIDNETNNEQEDKIDNETNNEQEDKIDNNINNEENTKQEESIKNELTDFEKYEKSENSFALIGIVSTCILIILVCIVLKFDKN